MCIYRLTLLLLSGGGEVRAGGLLLAGGDAFLEGGGEVLEGAGVVVDGALLGLLCLLSRVASLSVARLGGASDLLGGLVSGGRDGGGASDLLGVLVSGGRDGGGVLVWRPCPD